MFTGLVEAKGTLVRRTAHGAEARLLIQADFAREPLALGESIAVDGVCLTVAKITSPGPGPCAFEADASAETLSKTTLGHLTPGAAVNLERALAVGARMGGHIVSGHVDGVGRIAEKIAAGAGALKVVFEIPHELVRFVAPKGSIGVCGVSLTVNGVSDRGFDVVLVPHTRENTSLDALPVGAPVNLEVDMLARYVARLLECERGAGTTRHAGGGGGGADASATSDAAWTARLKTAGYL